MHGSRQLVRQNVAPAHLRGRCVPSAGALLVLVGSLGGALGLAPGRARADEPILWSVAPRGGLAMCLPPDAAGAAGLAPALDASMSSLVADRLELDEVSRALARFERSEAQGAAIDPATCRLSVALSSPSSSVAARARVLRVRCLLLADDPSAHAQLEQLLRLYPELPDETSLRLEAARAWLRAGRTAEGIAALDAIDLSFPGSVEALRAREQLAALREQGHALPARSPRDEVERASRLVRSGPVELARETLSRLAEAELPAALLARVLTLSARVARIEARFDDAAALTERARELDPRVATSAGEPSGEASVEAARAALRAIRLETLLDAGASEATQTRALRRASVARIAEAARIVARSALAEPTTRLVAELHRRPRVPCATIFELAVVASGTADDGALVAAIERCVDDPAHGVQARYLRARALERGGSVDDAIAAYRDVRRSDTSDTRFYALWAEQRLVLLGAALDGVGSAAPARADLVEAPPFDAPAALAELSRRHGLAYPWLARARELLLRGDTAGAREELHELYLAWLDARGRRSVRAGVEAVYRGASREPMDVPQALRRERRALAGNDLTTLVRVAESLDEVGLAMRLAGGTRANARPRAFEELVAGAASRHGIDPNLLFAVMRVESVYDPEIVSYAGAVGLLQIMPRTGRLIAGALGLSDFRTDDLLDPATNIEFAAWYLRSLLDRFEGRLPLAIAAYNGGPHNVRSWMERYATAMPLDAFLEQIPFSQTYRYVRRVLSHYAAYRAEAGLPMPLLDDTLPPRTTDTVAF